jgi:FtsH-binding integral membrane protein
VLRGVGLVGYGLGLVGLAIGCALLSGWVVTFAALFYGGGGAGLFGSIGAVLVLVLYIRITKQHIKKGSNLLKFC